MTKSELTKLVDKQIESVKRNLTDSPKSAELVLNRGMGFCAAMGEVGGYDVMDLLERLEAAVQEIKG